MLSAKTTDFQFLENLLNVNDFDPWPEGCFLAGGCFRSLVNGEHPKDYDLFFKSEKHLRDFCDNIQEQSGPDSGYPFKIIGNVCNFYTPYGVVQAIDKYFFSNPQEIIDHFDFTACAAVYDGELFYYHERFFVDNAQKRLVLTNDNVVFPLSTVKRALKYTGKGYRICPVGLSTILRKINTNSIDWNNPSQNEIDFYPDGTPTFRGFD